MLADTLAALQGSGLAVGLKSLPWIYAVVNAGHVIGVALLFGAIVPLDLRLLGVWRWLPIGELARVLLPMAMLGFAIVLVSGALLFSVEAVKYDDTTLFKVKLGLIFCALLNAALLRTTRVWRTRQETAFVRGEPRLRIAGAISLAAWLVVLVSGWMLGYL